MVKDNVHVLIELREAVRDGKCDDLWGKAYGTLERENLLSSDYSDDTGDTSIDDVKQNIGTMSFKECCTWLTWILRGERFCEGLFQECIDDGSFLSLLDRCIALEAESER